MARLPNPADMRRQSVSGQRSIARTDTSNADYGLSHLAGTLENISDRDTDYQIAEARTQFLARKAEQDAAYDQDQDHATIAQRYEQNMREAMEAAGANISIPRAREMFRKSVEPDLERGKQNMESLAFAKRRDERRARTNEQLNSLHDTAITGTAADMLSANETARQMLEAEVAAGNYSQEEAGNIYRAWRGNAAISRIQSMEPEDALRAIHAPWAQGIPAEARIKIQKQAEQDLQEDNAVRRADEIWAGDYGAAIAEARKIEDVDERELVISNLNALKAQDDAAASEDREKAGNEGLQIIVDGGRYGSIPAEVRERMGAENAYRLQEIDRRRQEEAAKSADMTAATKAQLKALSQMNEGFINTRRAENPELYLMGPSVWANEAPELAEAFENMRGEDQIAMMEDIAQRRTGGLETDAIDKIMAELIPAIEFYGPSDVGGDFKKGSKRNGFTATEKAVRKELYALAREHSRKTGGELPTAEEARRMVAQAFILSDKASTQYLEQFDGNPYAALMSGYDQGFDMRRRAEAERLARAKLGRVPTQQEIQQVYDLLGPSE